MTGTSSANGKVPFPIPETSVNPSSWGPTSLPARFVGVPFTPFNKSERLGRVAAFGSLAAGAGGDYYNNSRPMRSAGQNAVAEKGADDDYELVDTQNASDANRGPKWGARRGRGGGVGGARGGAGRGGFGGFGGFGSRGFGNDAHYQDPSQVLLKGKQAKFLLQGSKRGKQWYRGGRGGGQGGGRRDFNDRDLIKDPAVKVQASWTQVDQFTFSSLATLSTAIPESETLLECGELWKYDDSLEKITTRTTRPIRLSSDTTFVYAGMLDDPVMESLILEGKGQIYATDEALAYLMTAPRSIKTWDLIFTRIDNNLFIDKRDDAMLEVLTVNETSTDRISEKDEARAKLPINSPDKLSIEATAVNQAVLMQSLRRDDPQSVKKQAHSNPFVFDESEAPPSQPISYRYKSFTLSSGVKMVVRTQIHALQESRATGENKSVNVYTLTEHDPKLNGTNVDWRRMMDNQRGAVLANELKNNAAKLGRWTVQSLLSGADAMKLAFASRVTPSDPTRHVLLGTSTAKPKDLATQINLHQKNMWGIVKAVCDLLLKEGEGKYFLVRDANRPMLRLYKVPMTTFEEDEDAEEGEEEEEEAEAALADGTPAPRAADAEEENPGDDEMFAGGNKAKVRPPKTS